MNYANNAQDECDRIINKSQLTDLIAMSASHLYRLEKDGNFPQRIRIGKRRVGWSLNEVMRWMEDQKNSRSSQRQKEGM